MWAVVHSGDARSVDQGRGSFVELAWTGRGTGMEVSWKWPAWGRGTLVELARGAVELSWNSAGRQRQTLPPAEAWRGTGVEFSWNALSALGAHPWMCRGTGAQRRGTRVDVVRICRGTGAQGRGTLVELGRRSRIGVPWNCRGTGTVGRGTLVELPWHGHCGAWNCRGTGREKAPLSVACRRIMRGCGACHGHGARVWTGRGTGQERAGRQGWGRG